MTLLSESPEGSVTYDRTARLLHWLVAALLACQYLTAVFLPAIELDTPVDQVVGLHFSIGLVIALVMVFRLARRWGHPVAVAPDDGSPWERVLAKSTHRIFYAALIGGPFLGWAAASAHSIPVRLFGWVQLPAIAPRQAAWGYLAGDIHGVAMWTVLVLVALHVAAAFFHHFVRRDGVLRRMWPQ